MKLYASRLGKPTRASERVDGWTTVYPEQVILSSAIPIRYEVELVHADGDLSKVVFIVDAYRPFPWYLPLGTGIADVSVVSLGSDAGDAYINYI